MGTVDIGISGSCRGRARRAPRPVFVDGRKAATLRGPNIAKEFQKMVADYIERRMWTR